MRVCIVAGVYPPERIGGVSEVTYNLQKYLKKICVDVIVITSGKKNSEYPNTIRLARGPTFFLFSSFILFPNILKKIHIDVLHFQGNSGAGIILWKLIFRKKFPIVITTLHTSPLKEMKETKSIKINGTTVCKLSKDEVIFKYIKSPINIILDLLVTHLSDKIVSVCKETKKDCSKQYFISQKKHSVLYNGVDQQRFAQGLDNLFVIDKYNLHNSTLILFVGVFRVLKRMPNLLYAMKEIIKEIPNAKLLIVGGGWGYEKEIRSLCKRLHLDNCVVFAGRIINNEMPSYYAAADVIVVPSSYESFPMVILETMASGKPIVATNVGGISEIVINNETGFLIQKDNIDQLIDKICVLLKDPKKRETMGKNAKKIVIQNYNWEKIANQYKLEYQKLLEDCS